MGEVLRILAQGTVKGDSVSIELNDASSEFGVKTIHVQSKSGRVELSLKEFRALTVAVASASNKLNGYKKNG